MSYPTTASIFNDLKHGCFDLDSARLYFHDHNALTSAKSKYHTDDYYHEDDMMLLLNASDDIAWRKQVSAWWFNSESGSTQMFYIRAAQQPELVKKLMPYNALVQEWYKQNLKHDYLAVCHVETFNANKVMKALYSNPLTSKTWWYQELSTMLDLAQKLTSTQAKDLFFRWGLYMPDSPIKDWRDTMASMVDRLKTNYPELSHAYAAGLLWNQALNIVDPTFKEWVSKTVNYHRFVEQPSQSITIKDLARYFECNAWFEDDPQSACYAPSNVKLRQYTHVESCEHIWQCLLAPYITKSTPEGYMDCLALVFDADNLDAMRKWARTAADTHNGNATTITLPTHIDEAATSTLHSSM